MIELKHKKLVFIKFFKITGIFWVIFMTQNFSLSQINLIKNPSFENLNCSPQTHYDFHCVEDWWNVNNNTIDVWNRFGSIGNDFYSNGLGPQNTLWGDNYCSIALCARWFSMSPPYSAPSFDVPDIYGYSNFELIEVLGGSFSSELIKDKVYLFEFYINVPDYTYIQDDPDQSYLISNSLDFYTLYDDTMNLSNPNTYSNFGNRIFKNEVVFKDTINWTKISGCFKAKGGEKYFAVGPIRDTTEILFEEFISWGNDITVISGIYLDNFSLVECDTCCLGEFPYEDHVSVASNPGSASSPTTFSVLLNPNTSGILSVYDSAGRLVAKEECSELLTIYTLPELANGIYQYALTTSNGVKDVGKVLVVD
jgi:hypothetical protein